VLAKATAIRLADILAHPKRRAKYRMGADQLSEFRISGLHEGSLASRMAGRVGDVRNAVRPDNLLLLRYSQISETNRPFRASNM
jgi:hypothetical protein